MTDEGPRRGLRPQGGATRRAQHPLERVFEFSPGEAVDENGELLFDGERRDGGMSVVLKVKHRRTGEVRACKIMRPEVVESAADRAMFEDEFKRAHRVAGPHVVHVYDMTAVRGDAGDADVELLCYTMDWLPGPDLATVVRGAPGGLDPERAFSLALQGAEGLAEIHAREVLHLDLKPSNLLLDGSDEVQLVDFGIAKELRYKRKAETNWLTSDYAPYELRENLEDRIGPATDVYQLARVVYELFTGVPLSLLSRRHLSSEIDFIPEELDDLIATSTDEDVLLRPESGAEFLEHLRSAHKLFLENRARNRPRPKRNTGQLWEQLKNLRTLAEPSWDLQASLGRAILEDLEGSASGWSLSRRGVKQEDVARILAEAEGALRLRRQRKFNTFLERSDWTGAEGFIAKSDGRIEVGELEEYRRALELRRLESTAEVALDPERAREIRDRVHELAGAHDYSPSDQARVLNLLERVVGYLPHPLGEPMAPEPPTDLEDGLTCEFEVVTGGETRICLLFRSSELRLGRGPLSEFGNHIDLRPTHDDLATAPDLARACMRISRRGHVVFRLETAIARVECGGDSGINVDGQEVKSGGVRELKETGTVEIGRGASLWRYSVQRGASGQLAGVFIQGLSGVGAGRRAALAFRPFTAGLLGASLEPWKLMVVPKADGWMIKAGTSGLKVGSRSVAQREEVFWPVEEPISDGKGRCLRWKQR